MLTARTTARKSANAPFANAPFGNVVLASDERHLRRKVLRLQQGEEVLVDLAIATALGHGDRLLLDDGREVEVIAAHERLLEARSPDSEALAKLAWHIGNRHLPAQIEADRILIGYDNVIRVMLIGLGADLREVSEPFHPVRGAYHSAAGGHDHGHAHVHAHGHDHGHDHGHTPGRR